jgi:hypothetical protein
MLCLQRYLGVPQLSQWIRCTRFYNISTPQTSPVSFNLTFLKEGDYMVAVYPLGNVQNYTRNATITLCGNRCANGMAGPQCNESLVTLLSNHSVTLNLTSSVAYLTTKVAMSTAYFSLRSSSQSNGTLTLFAREGSMPQTNGLNDAEGDNVLNVTVPSPGHWYFAVTVNGSSPVTNVSLLSQQCNVSANEGGPSCSSPITDLTSLHPGALFKFYPSANSWTYFKYFINSSLSSTLWFTVAPLNPKNTSSDAFKVYVRYGVLPTQSQADFVGCSAEYCPVNSVQLSVANSAQGPWYIGVLTSPNANAPFGIWLDSVCANNCSGKGTCATSGPNMGLCSCNTGFTLVDCSVAEFPTEYIVLIVMGSLIVLSAMIGLIAWLYMKKKNKQYEEIN